MRNFLKEYQEQKAQMDDRFFFDQSYSKDQYKKDSQSLDAYYSRYIFLPKGEKK